MKTPKIWTVKSEMTVREVMKCARNAVLGGDQIKGISYVLDGNIPTDMLKSADVLRGFTGDQIADALLDYIKIQHASVAVAVRGKPQ